MKAAAGTALLASAFAPLVFLLALVNLQTLGWIAWLLLAASLWSTQALLRVVRGLGGVQGRPMESVSVRHADERVLGFSSTYLVPVVVSLFGDPVLPTAIATIALVLLLALIYVRGELYYLNPSLALLGYRLYEVVSSSGEAAMVLSRRQHLPQNGVLHCTFLSRTVAIEFGAPS